MEKAFIINRLGGVKLIIYIIELLLSRYTNEVPRVEGYGIKPLFILLYIYIYILSNKNKE